MEAVEDSTRLRPQYHKAQQAYSRTQGETYRTIGLLQHYKAQKIQTEVNKEELDASVVARIAETHLQAVGQITKEWVVHGFADTDGGSPTKPGSTDEGCCADEEQKYVVTFAAVT
eukprot:Gb_10060 [translate_table: standard]